MKIRAETLGCAIPTRDFDAVVHSVFRRACNLQIAGSSLIALHNSKFGKLPQGITLALPEAFSFESAGFCRGQRVTCPAGVIITDPLPVHLDLNTPHRWRAALQSNPI